MPTILAKDVGALLAELPNWTPEPVNVFSADVMIIAVGFEDRTTILLEEWLRHGSHQRCCILIRYTTNPEDNETNWRRCRELLASSGVKLEEVDYEQRNLAFKISEKIGAAQSKTGVLVDISSIASFVFFPLFNALVNIVERKNLWVGYVEAMEYFPKKDEWDRFAVALDTKDLVDRAQFFEEHYFQSKGTESIYECVSFIGKNPDQLPGKLILIPNFSFHRVFNMQEYAFRSYSISRADTEWIIGSPPNAGTNGWRANAVYDLCRKPQKCSYCCTLNYKDILSKLHSIWEDNYDEKAMCIASMGSKAQHIGTFLFLLIHPEVSLILSEPKEFAAKKFSLGVGDKWFLDFGEGSTLRRKVEGWNNLEFRWPSL